jgi:hypothetical protein
MSLLSSIKRVLKMCGHALNITVHEQLSAAELERQANATNVEFKIGKLMETEAGLLQASIHIIENLHALAGQTIVRSDANPKSTTLPEIALLEYLYSHVPVRVAVHVDCGQAEIAATLRRAGYEVYCATTGRGEIPQSVGLITLGCDPVPAIRELGDRTAAVIAADLTAPLDALISEMRSRQYHWHLVLYRIRNGSADHDTNPTSASYFANRDAVPSDAHGSVFFFRDYKVFAEAQAWCAAILPRTYFKPPPA